MFKRSTTYFGSYPSVHFGLRMMRRSLLFNVFDIYSLEIYEIASDRVIKHWRKPDNQNMAEARAVIKKLEQFWPCCFLCKEWPEGGPK